MNRNLPEIAYVTNTLHAQGPDGVPPVLAIRCGEPGYHPIYTHATADSLNEGMGITPAQREAMLAGSMFGWECPAAQPENYDIDGKLHHSPKRPRYYVDINTSENAILLPKGADYAQNFSRYWFRDLDDAAAFRALALESHDAINVSNVTCP
jgi:hypothetical protein